MNKKEMIAYLLNHDKYGRQYGPAYHFAWNVKMHFDLDWTGWKGEETMGEGIEHRWDERWDKYVESNLLDNWMFEDVRQQFRLSDDGLDYASYHSNYTDQGDWEFHFVGRSGGWLALNSWLDNELEGIDWTELRDWLADLSDKDLTFFYNCIHHMDTTEFTKSNIRRVANECITSIRATLELKWKQEAAKMASAYITGVAMN